MRKSLLAIIALMGTSAFAGQGMQVPPVPKEFAKVAFMSGTWSGNLKIYGMGPNPTPGTSRVVCKRTLDNRYLQSNHVMSMGQMGKMEGMHLISFDPIKKVFVAFWFDSSSPGVLEVSGNFNGSVLTMVSKPTVIPGMPDPMTMRAIYDKRSDKHYIFRLESKQGTTWKPMIVGEYRKTGN